MIPPIPVERIRIRPGFLLLPSSVNLVVAERRRGGPCLSYITKEREKK